MNKREEAYDKIDRYLRNNLFSEDYADYSEALEALYAAPEREDAQTVWLAIAEEAECVVQGGRKYLLLSEEMCVRLGGALGL